MELIQVRLTYGISRWPGRTHVAIKTGRTLETSRQSERVSRPLGPLWGCRTEEHLSSAFEEMRKHGIVYLTLSPFSPAVPDNPIGPLCP